MTPQRPIELVNASKACAEAWLKRDAMIDAGDKEGVKAMDLTCDLLQERYNSIYRQWQELGGTSNIDSITFPPALAEVPHFEDGFSDERITLQGRRYSPKKEAETREWWNEHYSPENVQKRLAEYRAAADKDTIADIMAGL